MNADFCEASQDHIHKLHSLYLCFEAVSGLKISFGKKELVVLAGSVDNIGSWTGTFVVGYHLYS